MDEVQPDADRLVAGSAVVAFAISLVALAAAGLGPFAAIPGVAGMVASLRARVQLKESPYRGYGISLVAFMLSVGVLAWALIPLLTPIVGSLLFMVLN